jgi:thiamine-phosphate pyrophosphorylase
MRPADVRLCVITLRQEGADRDHLAVAREALRGGADMIQLRDKTGSLRDLLPQARAIRALCRERGALFIVNDRVDLALAVDADGAHVGQEDLPAGEARRLLGPRLLGVSTHDRAQAEAAAAAGADYIGFGPMFATSSKETGYPPRGLAWLEEIHRAVRLPILAIGGITLDNVAGVVAAGATAPAVISAVAGAPDVAEAARQFRARVLQARAGRSPLS